jgi:signal peptidase I
MIGRFLLTKGIPLAVAIGLAFWLRILWVQCYVIPDNSMEPTFVQGDWILTTSSDGGTHWEKGDFVLVSTTPDPWRSPRISQKKPGTFLKRIVASSGDSISFLDGIFRVNGTILIPQTINEDPSIVSPKDPRFYIPALKLPVPRDTLFFSELPLREWDMAAHLMIQENPHLNITTQVQLFKGEQEILPEEYSKYINLVSKKISSDVFNDMSWFDLASLKEQLNERFPDSSFIFRKQLFVNGTLTAKYILKNPCYYVLGDNWIESVDSRYWGPISPSQITGKPIWALWNYSSKEFKFLLRSI